MVHISTSKNITVMKQMGISILMTNMIQLKKYIKSMFPFIVIFQGYYMPCCVSSFCSQPFRQCYSTKNRSDLWNLGNYRRKCTTVKERKYILYHDYTFDGKNLIIRFLGLFWAIWFFLIMPTCLTIDVPEWNRFCEK